MLVVLLSTLSQSEPATPEVVWRIASQGQAELILSGCTDGTYLVWERSGIPADVLDPSLSSINTYNITVV